MNDNPKRAPKRHWRRLMLVAFVLLGAAAAFVLQNRSDGRPPERTEPEAVAVKAAAAVQKDSTGSADGHRDGGELCLGFD